jgi:hypothetical protein
MSKWIVAAAVVTMFTSGCGYTVRAYRDDVVFQTLEVLNVDGEALEGAKIFVNQDAAGITNGDGVVNHELDAPGKDEFFHLKVQAAGYQSFESKVTAIIDPGFLAGDIILGIATGGFPMIIMLAVDGVTDGWLAYPRHIQIVMQKDGAPPDTGDKSKKTGKIHRRKGKKAKQ